MKVNWRGNRVACAGDGRLRRDRSDRFAISVPLLAQNRLRAIAEDIDLNAWRLARHPSVQC